MCCSQTPYHAPATPNLGKLYDQEQALTQQWAPSNAALASNLYSQYAPQYVGTNNAILESLRGLSPEDRDIADQTARSGMASRGNINGDANVGEEVMNRSDYSLNRAAQKIGAMGGLGAAGGNMANGTNYFNPNIGPTGQQAGLSLYQGQTQNAQNQYMADKANNPFTQALSALGSVAKIAGAAAMI